MGSSDYMRHQGKEGRRRKTRAAPRTYHHKVTVPRPHSSCQLSRLRSNHVRLHRARTPVVPPFHSIHPPRHSILLLPSEVPSPQHTFQATATSINFFTRALRPPTPLSLSPCACETRDGGHVLPVTARKRGLAWQSVF